MAKEKLTAERTIETINREHAIMLTDEVSAQLKKFHLFWCFADYRCLMKNNDHGPRGAIPPVIPYAPFTRSRVYTGTAQTGSYNHHSQLAKFKGRYYFAWSNGLIDEEAEGQRILISSSEDARLWSEPICLAGGEKGTTMVHNCIAMCARDDNLYIVGMSEDAIIDANVIGMRRITPGSYQLDLYSSPDGVRWQKALAFSNDIKWIFEAPRLTADGHLMCVAAIKGNNPGILRWPGDKIYEHPEIIPILQPEGARFPYGEGSWYQTDDGRIIIFWRDEGQSCRVWVNYSDDGGKTFAPVMISDIPDSMSRIYVGRLKDRRYYLCNNAFFTLMNRLHLMLLLSDDGYKFNKAYLLIDDPTSQRLKGLLKVDGYQYPCCLEEEGRLLIGYSVNKEDIECGIVDLTLI